MTRSLDEFLHAPARLSVMALLAPAEWVTFAFLRDSIGTSDSALSKQLSALEGAGYLEVRKDRGAVRSTSARLTPAGQAAFAAYLADLEDLVARARGGPRPSARDELPATAAPTVAPRSSRP